jgi:hypothetical protein
MWGEFDQVTALDPGGQKAEFVQAPILQDDRREARIQHHLQRLTKLGYQPEMHT